MGQQLRGLVRLQASEKSILRFSEMLSYVQVSVEEAVAVDMAVADTVSSAIRLVGPLLTLRVGGQGGGYGGQGGYGVCRRDRWPVNSC